MDETPDAHKWDPKYYKVSPSKCTNAESRSSSVCSQGLGTSTDADARDYFNHMAKHVIPFSKKVEGDSELIDLAFSKKKADERKEWLRQFKVSDTLSSNVPTVLTLAKTSLVHTLTTESTRFHTLNSLTRN